MKKVKIALWIIVLGLVGLVIGQNWEFFKAENSLFINLFFMKYQTPFLANAIFFVAIFFVGLLVSYFFGLFKHFRDAKTIRELRAKESSLVETIASMEKELAARKVIAEPVAAVPVENEPVEMAAQVK